MTDSNGDNTDRLDDLQERIDELAEIIGDILYKLLHLEEMIAEEEKKNDKD